VGDRLATRCRARRRRDRLRGSSRRQRSHALCSAPRARAARGAHRDRRAADRRPRRRRDADPRHRARAVVDVIMEKTRRRGLLDLVAASMAVYAMVIGTPVGGLVVRAYRYALGSRAKERPLLSYFQSEGAGSGVAPVILEAPKPDSATSVVAKKVGIT